MQCMPAVVGGLGPCVSKSFHENCSTLHPSIHTAKLRCRGPMTHRQRRSLTTGGSVNFFGKLALSCSPCLLENGDRTSSSQMISKKEKNGACRTVNNGADATPQAPRPTTQGTTGGCVVDTKQRDYAKHCAMMREHKAKKMEARAAALAQVGHGSFMCSNSYSSAGSWHSFGGTKGHCWQCPHKAPPVFPRRAFLRAAATPQQVIQGHPQCCSSRSRRQSPPGPSLLHQLGSTAAVPSGLPPRRR